MYSYQRLNKKNKILTQDSLEVSRQMPLREKTNQNDGYLLHDKYLEYKARFPSLQKYFPETTINRQQKLQSLNSLDKKFIQDLNNNVVFLVLNNQRESRKSKINIMKRSLNPSLSLQPQNNLGILDGFTMGGLIGKGSYAVVKSAQCNDSKQKVAIKVYDKLKLHDPMKKKNVEREISILKQLDHQNIIKLIKTVETSQQLNLIMEHGGQVSLKEYVRQKGGKLKEIEVKDIMRQVLSAVAYIHSNGVVHRDIKLDNILLDSQLKVKLIDFGFAIQVDPQHKINIFCGTPSYMAPEIIQKTVSYSSGVDVWACGVIMYYLLTGVLPFKGKNEKELFKKIGVGTFSKLGEDQQGASNLVDKLLNINQHLRISAYQASQDTWISPIDIKNQIIQLKKYQYLLLQKPILNN